MQCTFFFFIQSVSNKSLLGTHTMKGREVVNKNRKSVNVSTPVELKVLSQEADVWEEKKLVCPTQYREINAQLLAIEARENPTASRRSEQRAGKPWFA